MSLPQPAPSKSNHWATLEVAKFLVRRYGVSAKAIAVERAIDAAAQSDHIRAKAWDEVTAVLHTGFADIAATEAHR
jgi:hypothetical protein